MKRKLLCVAVALVMILPLAFAAIPFSNATEFEKGGIGDFIHAADCFVGSQFIQNADGSVTMWYGVQGVTGANYGLTYNGALVQGPDYSGSIYFMMPETNASCTQGNVVFALGISGANWLDSNCDIILKVVDYSTHPTVGLGTEANLGKCFEMLTSWDGNPAVVGCNTTATYAQCDIKDYGEWNLFSFEVHGGLADLYINGVCILENYALAGAGTNFCFGINGDSGEATEGHATFKELILTEDLDTVQYFPSETVDLPFDTIVATTVSDPAPGIVSVNGDGDITLTVNTGFYPCVGVVTTDKVPIDGISVTFNKEVFTNVSPNGYFGILVSKAKPTTCNANMMGRSHAPDVKASQSLMLCVNGDSSGIYGPFALEGTTGTIAPLYGGGYNDALGEDCTVSFSPVYTKWVDVSGTMKAQKFVRVYVNGECLYSLVDLNAADVDEDWYVPNWVERPVEINVNKVVDADNMVYLSLTATGYGGSGGTVTVKDASYGDDAKMAPTVIGAQYRTTGTPGLRFATTIDKGSLFGGLAEIDHCGTLLIPVDRLDDPTQLVHTGDGTITSVTYAVAATAYLDVVATKNYKETGADFTFTAVLTGIPDGMEDRQFVARGYIAFTDGTIIYAEPIVRSINDVIANSQLPDYFVA